MHPQIVKRLLFPLHERLRGQRTLAKLEALERTQWLAPAELSELQFARLRQLVDYAYRYSPYYRQLLDEHDLPPSRLRSHADFEKIPPLTRDDVRRHFHELRTTPRRPRARRHSTGGSTGVPVTVLVDRERVEITDAVRLRSHGWFGLEPGAREIVLWGSPIELTKQDRLRSVRDWLVNSKLLSAFDLREVTLEQYGGVIRRYQPEKVFGYASALYVLACHLAKARGRPLGGLKAIFATAEPLFDFQRDAIANVFGCPVAVEYGARDAGLMANECPEGGLHIPAESMHLEILGGDADGQGEIVATNLYSFAFPIIRYCTGDRGSLAAAGCRCGRGLSCLRAVDGRQTDFLLTSTGRVLHALSIIYILRELPRIRQFRVLQEAVDHVVVSIVPEPAFSSADESALVARVHGLLGHDVRVDIERLPAIRTTASGKFRYVESKVSKQYLDRINVT
jgi:phenylacetate-CoA ligase